MIVIDRYDPRTDKDVIKEIFKDFIENKSYFRSNWQKFEEELNKRALNLSYRNSMVVAKENGKVVGWGTFTIFRDYLGIDCVLIHQVLTRKEDSFKKGIEEIVIRELEKYVKTTLKIDKAYYTCPDSDENMRAVFMKLNIKKSKFFWYEKEL